MMKGLIIHFFQGKENVAQCNGRNEVMNIKCPPESRLRRELHVRRVRKKNPHPRPRASGKIILKKTRPDTRLLQSGAAGQEQCWRRSLEHLGRSSGLKNLKKRQKSKQGTDRPTD